jgi:hypothetical protein
MPGISIALATFNGEKYLEAQLESLARQAALPAELVITDDASTDRTPEIIGNFAKRAPFPVRFHCNAARLGYRANFMQAAALCGSELIAYCDQDDIWESDKLAVMIPLFDDPDVLLAYHNATVIDRDGETVGQLYGGTSGLRKLAPLEWNPWSLVAGFTQVFRRALQKFSVLHPASVDPFWPAERLAHDQWYLFLASVFGSIVRDARPLVRYRQHGDNTFGWSDKHWLESPPAHFLRTESFIAAARNRAELLQAVSGRLSENEQARAAAAISYYDQLARRLADRASLYASPALTSRAKAFYALLRQDAYNPARGSARFGWKALLMDAYGGVPLGPRLGRRL